MPTDMFLNSNVAIALARKDREHLVEFCNFMGIDSSSVKDYIDNHFKTEMSSVSIGSMILCRDLHKFTKVTNKTYELYFPDLLDKKFMNSFILGYFDGDGGLDSDGGEISFTTHSNNINFMEKLNNELKVLGCPSNKIYDGKGDTIRLRVNRIEYKMNFYNNMYANSETFLKRKHNIFLQYIDKWKLKTQ